MYRHAVRVCTHTHTHYTSAIRSCTRRAAQLVALNTQPSKTGAGIAGPICSIRYQSTVASNTKPPVDKASIVSMYENAAQAFDGPNWSEADGAIAAVKSAAEAGYPPAVGRVGRWHLFGVCGCEQDVRRAVVLLHSAAQHGDAVAQFWLGRVFLEMETFVPQEPMDDAALPAAPDTPEQRTEKAKQVLSEIKRQRRIALQNKARKAQGLPLLPLTEASTVTAPADVDMRSVPLRKNIDLAYHWLLASAQQDNADAQVALGNLCMKAEYAARFATKDSVAHVKQAIGWYEVAAQVAHHSLPHSRVDHAKLDDPVTANAKDVNKVKLDDPVTVDAEEKVTPESKAAPNLKGASPHPDALYNLGMIYYEGIPGVVPLDRKRAAMYFQAAAQQLDASALFWLGTSMHHGDAEAGISVNPSEAMRNLELAASLGHPGAQHYLSRVYRNGDKVLGMKPDARKMRYFFDMAVESEHPEALLEVAENHYKGLDGYEADASLALRYYEKAAAAGSVEALVSAGAMYYKGEGTGQDFMKAFELYQQAGERGSIEAWENLAAMHVMGKGVPVNIAAASYIKNQILPALRKHHEQAAELAKQQQQQADECATVLGPEELGIESSGCGKASCACKTAAKAT